MTPPKRHPLEDLVPKGVRITPLAEVSDYDYEWWNGRLLIWEEPLPGEEYVIGVDPAEGAGEDRSAIEVLRRGTRTRPDEQVAEFCSDHHNPLELVPIVNMLGRFYASSEGEEALAIIECNTVGGADLQLTLRTQHDYGNLFVWKIYDKRTNLYTQRFGWWTNRTTRPKLIVRGMHALTHGDLLVNSPFLLDEMEDFERDPYTAKIKARSGRHDDRVIAFLISHVGAHDDEWIAGDDVAEERRVLTSAARLAEASKEGASTGEAPTPKVAADWQNTGCTLQQMYEAWDAVLDE
jgi:hypothetical protein